MIPYGRQWLDKEEITSVVETLQGNYLTQGPRLEEFEQAVANLCGARYAVAVSSGTAGLHLAAIACGLQPGDEGITSPNTFLASANCLVYVGARPCFADIRADTYCLDPIDFERRITPKTRVVIPVHFAGQPCDLEAIWDLAREKNLMVIEDAAHALGSRWLDQRGEWHTVGSCSHSHMTIFSFHPVKTITTGEGGMILTNDPELARKCHLLRHHGITRNSSEFTRCLSAPPWYYEMQELGFNYRMSELQAVLGLVQLKRLPFFMRRRREIWAYYQEKLGGLEGLSLPKERASVCSCWHLYALQTENRDSLLIFLRSRGIGAHAMYIPVHLQPYYQKRFEYRKGDFPVAEAYFDKSLILPLYPALKDEELDYIIKTVKSFFYETNH